MQLQKQSWIKFLRISLLPKERLLSINGDLAIQSRWHHYVKMCQIALITKKGSVSCIVRKPELPAPENTTRETHVTYGY